MFKYALKLYFLLQFLLIISWGIGEIAIPIKTDIPLGKNLGEFSNNSLVWSRANFDGLHYVKIAREGYQHLQQVFFPFYPNLIKLFQKLFENFIISGIFVSNLAFILMLIVFWKLLASENINRKAVKKILFLLVIFPTAFYFLGVYTESLFFLLVLLSFYFAGKKQYLWAGIAAGIASYTRLAGIFLFPALVLEYYYQVSQRGMKERLIALKNRIVRPRRNQFIWLLRSRFPHFKNLFFISLSCGGLLKYMYYLKQTCADWLYFIKVQPEFTVKRSTEKIILLYQVFWRYFKMILTVYPKQWVYFNIWLEFILAVFLLCLLVIGWFKREQYKIKESWLVFASLFYLFPTLTGTLSSIPRYALICFPCFLVLEKILGELKKKFAKIEPVYFIISLILLVILSAFFFRGYWVA